MANGFADAAAGLDAREAEIDWGIAESVSIVDGIAAKVLRRLTAMAMAIADLKRDPRPTRQPRRPRPDIAALAAASDHDLVRQAAGYRCSLCATHLTRSQLRAGEGDGCFPPDVHFRNLYGRPAPPPTGSAASSEVAARLGFHPTHRIGGFDGGHICWDCGAFSSSNRAVGLRRPCTTPTQAGRAARCRVAQGRAAKWMPRDAAEARTIARAALVDRACQLQQRHSEQAKAAALLEAPKRRRSVGKAPGAAILERWIGLDAGALGPETLPDASPQNGSPATVLLNAENSGIAGEIGYVVTNHLLDGGSADFDYGPVAGDDRDYLSMGELIEAYQFAAADGARAAEAFDDEDDFWGFEMG